MDLRYTSTRDSKQSVTASQAILQGLSPEGGLFVPCRIPKLDVSMDVLKELTYQEIAYEVMKLYLTDFTESELKTCISKAYDEKFDTEVIAPLVKVADTYYLELFHGKTIAFKDMALSILPHLMTTAAKKNQLDKEIVILTATSGDTGKAALAGFADVKGTKILVFYPKDGVSHVQELQMVTQEGDNVAVFAIEGNFDQAQSGVKSLFENDSMKEMLNQSGYQFSSANSINIGRLVPQIVYYVYTYAKLLQNEEIQSGEKIHVTVPTGNFGNILAAYYAKQMGVPIEKLLCASNENHVLVDFFQTGTYNRNREFRVTTSPSMDILISSNLERLIYHITGEDAEETKAYMQALKAEGVYKIRPEMQEKLQDFVAGFASQQECAAQIRAIYEQTGYVMDPHTAVASYVLDAYRKETSDHTKTVVASTASPYKFAKTVLTALDEKWKQEEEWTLFEELARVSNTQIPEAVTQVLHAPIRHTRTSAPNQMEQLVLEQLEMDGQ
jgi:threonine synthase